MSECPVDGCAKPVKRGGYCYGHYMKNWRYGTPNPRFSPRWDDMRGRRFGSLVVTGEREGRFWICVCDCGATTKADPGNLNLGNKTTCGNRAIHWRSDTAGYSAAHERIYRDRGAARDYACVDCAAPAQQWSYGHDDPDEMEAKEGAYSLDPKHYSPRCVPCHKRFDLGRLSAASTWTA